MAESALWATFNKHMRKFGHFERIENLVGSGRPDINYCVSGHEGNIELKQIAAWPVRPETVVSIPHYTPEQRVWHRQRGSAGGRVYVLLEVVLAGPWYGLLPARWARVALGKTATAEEVRRAALVSGRGRFPTEDLLMELTDGQRVTPSEK